MGRGVGEEAVCVSEHLKRSSYGGQVGMRVSNKRSGSGNGKEGSWFLFKFGVV